MDGYQNSEVPPAYYPAPQSMGGPPLGAAPYPSAPPPGPPQYQPAPGDPSKVMPLAQQPGAPVYVTVQPAPTVVLTNQLGPQPVVARCPLGHDVTTVVSYKSGSLVWIVAAIICFLVGPLCALIPFCVDSLKDVEHRCPQDGTLIGVYRRSL